MEINVKDVELVKSSWQIIAPKGFDMVTSFYNDLFDSHPDVVPLFKGDIGKQAEKLMYTLGFLVTNLDRFQEIKKSIKELGRVHAKAYKVSPDHYPAVKFCLIKSIQKAMGKDWSNDHKDAWYKVVSTVERTMIQGASEKKKFSFKFWN